MNILQYESDIWSVAEYFRGAGIKQSEWPRLMMPFFALRMVESRLLREVNSMVEEIGPVDESKMDDFVAYFQSKNMGYNDYVVRYGKTLKSICQNDKTVDSDFTNYLRAFDMETQNLLGVDKTDKEDKFLGISSVEGVLRGKNIFFDVLKVWSEIDLTPFNNSEITDLEEHIKRKWADISAETAGEQYTPEDIIALITDIVAERVDNSSHAYLQIYDPTCGGGNLLFGVEDRLAGQTHRPIKTSGMDWESSLYALAKIESRFRKDSDIRYGNTLTTIPFIGQKFDVIVANPPYGVDWKGFKKDIDNDQTGRFIDTPAVSDGQLLFDQHIAYHLSDNGIAVVVNNGSSLFSGDAGSGESNIRKYFFDQDWVEALIQMPTQEFFNTGIYTYLWVLNKNKPSDRKDKVLLIDGSHFWQQLKKSRGDKRREMTADNRRTIVEAFLTGQESDYCRVFSKYHFYYNKQKIILTNVDASGKCLQGTQKLDVSEVTVGDLTLKEFAWTPEEGASIVEAMSHFDYKQTPCLITDTKGNRYRYDAEQETLLMNGKPMGCGQIVLKPTLKKATKKTAAHYQLAVTLQPDTINDYEIIPYHPNEADNQRQIAEFMAQYVSRPFVYRDCIVGVEINFNKIFYRPEVLPSASQLMDDIKQIDQQLASLESAFNLEMDS